MKNLALLTLMLLAIFFGSCTIADIKAVQPVNQEKRTFVYHEAKMNYYFFWFTAESQINVICVADKKGDLNCK